MVLVQREDGVAVYINADLIEEVEPGYRTRLRLADGRELLVVDSAEDVVGRIRDFRASVLVSADRLVRAEHPPAKLTVLDRGDR